MQDDTTEPGKPWGRTLLRKAPPPKPQPTKYESFLDVTLKPVERAAALKLAAAKKAEEEEQVTQQISLQLHSSCPSM